jgi:DNA-binding NtrC family response regulator
MKKVLLISTDTAVLDFFKTHLVLLDMNVFTLKPSQNLLSDISQNRPDLLVIDFLLNNDNGGGLCHQIKCDGQLHDLPVILLCEYATLDRAASKFGCNIILSKPLNVDQLVKVINSLTDLQPAH